MRYKILRGIVIIIVMFLFLLPGKISMSMDPSSAEESQTGGGEKYIEYPYPEVILKLDSRSNKEIRLDLEIRNGENKSLRLKNSNWTNVITHANRNVFNTRYVFGALAEFDSVDSFISQGIIAPYVNNSMEIHITHFRYFFNRSLHIIQIEANITMLEEAPLRFVILPLIENYMEGEKGINIAPRVEFIVTAESDENHRFVISPTPTQHYRNWNGEKIELRKTFWTNTKDRTTWNLEFKEGKLLSPKNLFTFLCAALIISLPITISRFTLLVSRKRTFTILGFVLVSFLGLLFVVNPLIYFRPDLTAQTLFTMIIIQLMIPPILYLPFSTKKRKTKPNLKAQKIAVMKKIELEMSMVMGATPRQVTKLVEEIYQIRKNIKKNNFRTRRESHTGRKDTTEDPFKVLGISETADTRLVENAFKKMVKHYHPDQYENLPPRMRSFAQSELKKIIFSYESIKEDLKNNS